MMSPTHTKLDVASVDAMKGKPRRVPVAEVESSLVVIPGFSCKLPLRAPHPSRQRIRLAVPRTFSPLEP